MARRHLQEKVPAEKRGQENAISLARGPGHIPAGQHMEVQVLHALAAIGPEFEHHPAFPEGVNTEFVYIESPTSVVMRVWERGSGETFACGTGSCATVAALVLRGVCPRNVPVDVHLLGGTLSITITADDDILMTGPAETAFVGCVEV